MFKVSIPVISSDEVWKRYERIKPVIAVNGKLFYFRQFSFEELTSICYLWKPSENLVCKDDLKVLVGKDFLCLHSYEDPYVFKPCISEVLSQIDENDLPFVKAFEIIEKPEVIRDFSKDYFTSIAFANGYHVSTIRLYGEKV